MRFVLANVALVLVAGCVAHAPLSEDYAGPQERPIAVVDRFDVAAPAAFAASADFEPDEGRRRFGFTVRRVTLPPAAAGGQPIEFDYYDVDGGPRTPVVLVLPIFNGQPIVTRYFARYFAHQGWAALALHRERDPLEHLAQPEQAIRANLLDYRRVLDWVARQAAHDSRAIGLFGISFGAVDAVMLAAVDERVDALVAAMAGGDLSYLFMNTNYRRVSRAVDDLLAESGLTRDAFQRRLDDRISTDPLALAPYVDAERVLMILTRNDMIVPFEAQQALRLSIGAPETLYLPTGHRTSIVYFPMLRSSAFDFFERQFTVSLPSGGRPD
jgi:hypothetical protein